ncbi:hypothetical protein BDZ89DRAFT_1158094 [Hymenopellis radicata]|nr:hypothetical protein BDZ89DRAFT_1158094 [Hymenopellis radicata]
MILRSYKLEGLAPSLKPHVQYSMVYPSEPPGYYTITRQGPIDVGFKTEHPFVALVTVKGQLMLGSFVLGFFIGFGLFVVWAALEETRRARRASAYIIMIWVEIFFNLIFSVLAFCYLRAIVPPGLGVFLPCSICWIIQVWCLMFIIVNRVCLLLERPQKRILCFTVAAVLCVITISTSAIWTPAQLQINSNWIALNRWWDYVEKSMYLCLDLALNIVFIRTVKKSIVERGFTQYEAVMRYNMTLIAISIAMDVFLICLTLLPNYFVFAQFHGIVYIVKLQIEIILSRFLVTVARAMGVNVPYQKNHVTTNTTCPPYPHSQQETAAPVAVHVATQVFTHSEHALDVVPDSKRESSTVDGDDSNSQNSRYERKGQENSRFGCSESKHDIKVVPLPFVPPEYSD